MSFEKIIADRLYKNSSKAYTKCSVDKYSNEELQIKTDKYKAISKLLACHEIINGRFKEFTILKNIFHHDRNKHHLVFSAIAFITQIELKNGKPVFECPEYVDPIQNYII